MVVISYRSILVWTLLLGHCNGEEYTTRYQYKHSFKGPMLMQSDRTIPFWNYSGEAVPGDEQVRVVPSLRGKSGAVWSKHAFPFDSWQVDMHFRVSGRGKVGADGLVLWYVQTPGEDGPVFGSMDKWSGLGIFFDSFDNDNKRNNPYVSVISNDGTMEYSHANDGNDQKKGGCLLDFRNRPYPVKARVIYYQNTLIVKMDPGFSPQDDFEECARVENVDFPKDYFFGVSAATGGLADDHDVLKFMVSSIHELTEDAPPPEEEDEHEKERLRLQEEYLKNLEEFNKEQEDFRAKHPDQAKMEREYRAEDLFEGNKSPELQAIFEVQSELKKQVVFISASMNSLIAKQDILISHSSASDGQASDMMVAQSHEVENVNRMASVNRDYLLEVKEEIRFLKSTLMTVSGQVDKVHYMTNNLNTKNGGNTKNADSAGGAYDSVKNVQEIRERMDMMHGNIVSMMGKQAQAAKVKCPEPEIPSCVSVSTFLFIALIQVVILLVYHSVKHSREAAAKKFF